MEPIRILIANRDPRRRSLIRTTLETQQNIVVVGEAEGRLGALILLAGNPADVLIMDIEPEFSGLCSLFSPVPRELHPVLPALPPAPAENDTDRHLISLLLEMGIPAHIKGFRYLQEAVKLTLEDRSRITRMTKVLYPLIAQRCGSNPGSVERSIRHAIDIAWSRGRIDTLNRTLGCRAAAPEDKPTSGELIALLAESLSRSRNMC